MYAATLNSHVTEIVKRPLNERCVSNVLVTDSEVALHWLSTQTKQLKLWVRNRVIEINRFTKIGDWYHIESDLNPVDLGTRKGARVENVNGHSEWFKGKSWMVLPVKELKGSYLRDIDEVKYINEKEMEI